MTTTVYVEIISNNAETETTVCFQRKYPVNSENQKHRIVVTSK